MTQSITRAGPHVALHGLARAVCVLVFFFNNPSNFYIMNIISYCIKRCVMIYTDKLNGMRFVNGNPEPSL